jgi:chromosome segregation ATPase
MKFRNNFLFRITKSILIISFLISPIIQTSAAANKSFAVFSFYKSNIKLNGSDVNNFRGNVSLDREGKGIIITSTDGGQNEALLRLVSEKIDSESHLIDYRLMRSCDLKAKLKDNNSLMIDFSPKSLENRNKNEKFNIQVEIFNYKNLIPEDNHKTEADIKDYLKSECTNRKTSINLLKNKFEAAVTNYHFNSKKLNKLNDKINSQSQEYENLKNAIQDTEAQIKDINYLQNSYQMQLKSISSITTGANKLMGKENEKRNEIITKQNEINKVINQRLEKLKLNEEKLNSIKEKHSKNMEKSKEVENMIINYQKDLAEVEDKLSDIKSNKLRLEFDLKNAESLKKTNEKSVKEIENEIKDLKKRNRDHSSKINKLNEEKSNAEDAINIEKEDIKKIEQDINDLILKKSKKEDSLKNKYDTVKTKQDEIENLKIEADQFLANIKRFNDKKEKLETKDKLDISSQLDNIHNKISNYTHKLDKEEKNKLFISKNLYQENTKKDAINKNLFDNNIEIERLNNLINGLNKERMDLEKNRSDYTAEIKDKENKLKNLRKESENYDGEIENVKKSLISAKENLITFKSILSDFQNKLSPLENRKKEYSTQKKDYQDGLQSEKKTIIDSATRLKRFTPAATVMIDLAEDDALNELNEDSENKAKWKILIDKIIS